MRRFSGRLVIAALAIGGGYAVARVLAPLEVPGSAQVAALATPWMLAGGVPSAGVAGTSAIATLHDPATGDGDRLVRTVLDTLEKRPNIAAGVLQSVRLEDQSLTAEGKYWHRSVGNGRRTRWELTTKVDDATAYVTQVFDGDEVWTDRKYEGIRKISRIDVDSIKREFTPGSKTNGDGAGAAPDAAVELLARGGLSQLMSELGRCFTFAQPQTMRRGEQLVLAVIGTWRTEPLTRHWPAAAGGDWPAHLPHHVLLHIDSDDYFPYYIEYRGGDERNAATSQTAHFPVRDPLSSIEFIDVRFDAAMDEQLFEFAPGDAGFHDGTARLIEQLRPRVEHPAPDQSVRRPEMWR